MVSWLLAREMCSRVTFSFADTADMISWSPSSPKEQEFKFRWAKVCEVSMKLARIFDPSRPNVFPDRFNRFSGRSDMAFNTISK